MLRSLAWPVPRKCVVCELQPGTEGFAICSECEADFFARTAARCERCAIRVPEKGAGEQYVCGRCLATAPHFDATTALADYVSPVDGMVMALKFTARLDLAHFFGRFLARRVPMPTLGTSDAIVVPVPLAFERAQQRGFNQAQHIARAFAATTGCKLVVDTLLRTRDTPPQQTLALTERRRNIRGAFATTRDLKGHYVFVVDDVMTTGSTLDEVARVLKSAGTTYVHNLIIARTP